MMIRLERPGGTYRIPGSSWWLGSLRAGGGLRAGQERGGRRRAALARAGQPLGRPSRAAIPRTRRSAS